MRSSSESKIVLLSITLHRRLGCGAVKGIIICVARRQDKYRQPRPFASPYGGWWLRCRSWIFGTVSAGCLRVNFGCWMICKSTKKQLQIGKHASHSNESARGSSQKVLLCTRPAPRSHLICPLHNSFTKRDTHDYEAPHTIACKQPLALRCDAAPKRHGGEKPAHG